MAGSTHIPVRTCMACRRKGQKPEMIRVVLQADVAQKDESHKMSGRGIYVCGQDCYNKLEGNFTKILQSKRSQKEARNKQ